MSRAIEMGACGLAVSLLAAILLPSPPAHAADLGFTEVCDCGPVWGDVTGDSLINPLDVIVMVNAVYKGVDAIQQPPACPRPAGDADCDGAHTPADVIIYVMKVYHGHDQFCPKPCPHGRFIGRSDCLGSAEPAAVETIPDTLDCLQYDYDGASVLTLRHLNAGFNCCPDMAFDIRVVADTITIEEIEISGECDCSCLYNLDFEIYNLPCGMYTITVIEPLTWPTDPPLRFTVDLASSPSGIFCVPRNHYPWGY
jgi:hypothetical protein